ncbi:MAG: hypothetical protein M3R04_07105, partial [bacterium]|nr:hypothetical protein [bacterium]
MISAAATYAAMMAWPALEELMYPQPAGSSVPAASTPTPTPTPTSFSPPVLAAGVIPSPATALPVAAAPTPAPTPTTQASFASSQLAPLQTYRADMKYARFSVALRNKPGGVALRPVS